MGQVVTLRIKIRYLSYQRNVLTSDIVVILSLNTLPIIAKSSGLVKHNCIRGRVITECGQFLYAKLHNTFFCDDINLYDGSFARAQQHFRMK